MIRGNTQVMLNSIDIGRLELNFLDGSDWDISNGNNDATITGLKDGANPRDAVNLQQMMDLLNGTRIKEVRVIATTNMTLTGSATVDGVTLATGDRIACFEQTTFTEDGIYIVDTSGAWTRASDFPVGHQARSTKILVSEGTAEADTEWTITNDKGHDVIGTDNIIVVRTGTSGTIGANNGLTLSGSEIILGGTLNQGTTVNMSTYSFDFSGTGAFGISTNSITFDGNGANNVTLNDAPDGTVSLAVATTGYVDSTIANGYSFDNGLTASGSNPVNVKLGGNLDSGNTNIGLSNGSYLNFTGNLSGATQGRFRAEINQTSAGSYTRLELNDNQLYLWSGAQAYGTNGFESSISMGMGSLQLMVEDSGSSQVTSINVGSLRVTDTSNNRGLTYTSDYSANYTLRSLVDREYVDKATANPQYDELTVSSSIVTLTQGGTSEVPQDVYLNGVRLRSTQYALGDDGTNTTIAGTASQTFTDGDFVEVKYVLV